MICAATSWDDILSRFGSGARADRTYRAHLYRGEVLHHLLRHGHDAAPLGHTKRAADRQSAADAGQFRQARRGDLSGARPFQRAGRPDGGNHGDPERRNCWRRSRRCSASGRRKHHGHAVVDALQAMIDGRAKVFIGLGGNFVAATPDTEIRPLCDAATETDGRHQHQAEPRSCRARQEALILPCLARSDIDVQATGRQSVTVEDSMSMVHASSGLVTPPSPHLKSEVAIICGMARATLPAQRHRLGRDGGKLRPDPRQDRGRLSKAVRELQRPHPSARRLPPCTTARASASGIHPIGRANFLVMPRASPRIRRPRDANALR